MKIPQHIKGRIPAVIEKGLYHTANMVADIRVHEVDTDGTARVSVGQDWVAADDCLELAAFFKRLAKQLSAAGG